MSIGGRDIYVKCDECILYILTRTRSNKIVVQICLDLENILIKVKNRIRSITQKYLHQLKYTHAPTYICVLDLQLTSDTLEMVMVRGKE